MAKSRCAPSGDALDVRVGEPPCASAAQWRSRNTTAGLAPRSRAKAASGVAARPLASSHAAIASALRE
jgi:hypothetical protein